jgi:hypothetical protein
MKSLALFLFVACLSTALHAGSFIAEQPFSVLAEVLQKRVPELAVDRLFEAKRGNAEWHYAFWTKAEKTWVEEVRVSVRQKSSSSSDVKVEVFRIDGGLAKTSSKPQPVAAADWTEKIRVLLKK